MTDLTELKTGLRVKCDVNNCPVSSAEDRGFGWYGIWIHWKNWATLCGEIFLINRWNISALFTHRLLPYVALDNKYITKLFHNLQINLLKWRTYSQKIFNLYYQVINFTKVWYVKCPALYQQILVQGKGSEWLKFSQICFKIFI